MRLSVLYNEVTNTYQVVAYLQDVPLFEGIISDLFPGVELPQPDYDVFLDALNASIAKRNLQAVPWFIDKIIQVISLYRRSVLLN